jgi:hypothetical protein
MSPLVNKSEPHFANNKKYTKETPNHKKKDEASLTLVHKKYTKETPNHKNKDEALDLISRALN